MTTWQAEARHFLDHETQFHLGMLPSEQAHAKTRGLADVLQQDVAAGLRLLQSVDEEVADSAEGVLASEAFAELVRVLTSTFTAGGRVCFSGCGATGRLSILLEACWRHFWQTAADRDPELGAVCQGLGDQVCSIMTGGDYALIRSVENFEDHVAFGRQQVREAGLGEGDVLVAISEGGETSSVIGTIWEAHERGARTFFAFNNPADILAEHIERSRDVIEHPDVIILDLTSGPMGVAGSTRMQATTAELLVVGAALDLACEAVLPEAVAARERDADATMQTPQEYMNAFCSLLADLAQPTSVAAMADWTAFERDLYERKGLITYFADECLLDIFTDTTERSPTFMLPPFRKCDDTISLPSWAFVKSPLLSTPNAWERVLGRPTRCLEWTPELYAQMDAPENVRRQPPVLGAAAIQKFHIGSEADISRTAPTATAAVLAVLGSELNGAGDSAASVSAAFGPAAEGFAERAAIVIGGEEPEPSGVERIFHVPCAIAPTHMKLFERLAVKLAFNNVSTATMGCMGRLVGNWMAFVDTSNKKLIDRGSRLVSELAEVDYETACYALHETNEMLRTTLSPGDEKPSPVALTIERLQQPPLEPRTS